MLRDFLLPLSAALMHLLPLRGIYANQENAIAALHFLEAMVSRRRLSVPACSVLRTSSKMRHI